MAKKDVDVPIHFKSWVPLIRETNLEVAELLNLKVYLRPPKHMSLSTKEIYAAIFPTVVFFFYGLPFASLGNRTFPS